MGELNNLTETTKQWIRNKFGNVPISFFEHIRKCVEKGVLVSKDGKTNYAAAEPKTAALFVFLTGTLNKCFRSQSQQNTYQYFGCVIKCMMSVDFVYKEPNG
jgi:hypothetical protein